MFTEEQKIRAIELYFKYGKKLAPVVRELGYPSKMSTTDEKWFFRNLGGDFHASGLMTLCLSSSNPARPYIWRFNIFRRFT